MNDQESSFYPVPNLLPKSKFFYTTQSTVATSTTFKAQQWYPPDPSSPTPLGKRTPQDLRSHSSSNGPCFSQQTESRPRLWRQEKHVTFLVHQKFCSWRWHFYSIVSKLWKGMFFHEISRNFPRIDYFQCRNNTFLIETLFVLKNWRCVWWLQVVYTLDFRLY